MLKQWNYVVIEIGGQLVSGYVRRCDQERQLFLIKTKAGEAWFPRTMLHKIGEETITFKSSLKEE